MIRRTIAVMLSAGLLSWAGAPAPGQGSLLGQPAEPAPTTPPPITPGSDPAAPPGTPGAPGAAPQEKIAPAPLAPGIPGDTNIDSLPPPVKLGQRAKALKQRLRARPIVVLVKDQAEFADAVTAWKLPWDFWPVLIDDGGDITRENIARFVRAYKPRAVVRWAPQPGAEPWPADAAARGARITSAYHGAWDSGSMAEVIENWRAERHRAPGLVLTNPDDPAWPAALTLAAAKGQRLAFIDIPRGEPGDTMSAEQVAALVLATEEAARATEMTWDSTGDDLDALTLVANTPSKIRAIAGGGVMHTLALTDRLCRKPDTERWGWAGMIFGDSATAAYRAMCSVFIGIEDAWAFDGYAVGSVPGQYNLKPITEILMGTPYKAAFDHMRTGAAEFRRATAAGITGGIVYVNTKGTMWNFELAPGRLYSFDVPFLNMPGVVHFTHSFSAQVVNHRSAIAGRWLENGAFAYFGSVDEPFLNAFVMGPDFFLRFFFYGATFPGAARFEKHPIWKLNYYGDPLVIAGAGPIRLDEVMPSEGPLAGLASLEEQVRADLKAGKVVPAAASLVMLGRDKDAARLCLAGVRPSAANDNKMSPNAERLGAIGAPAAFRDRDPIGAVTLIAAMPANLQADPFYVSLLWQAGRPLLDSNPSRQALETLKNNVRELCAKEDLEALTPAVRNAEGRDGITAMWRKVISRTTDAGSKQELESALEQALRR